MCPELALPVLLFVAHGDVHLQTAALHGSLAQRSGGVAVLPAQRMAANLAAAPAPRQRSSTAPAHLLQSCTLDGCWGFFLTSASSWLNATMQSESGAAGAGQVTVTADMVCVTVRDLSAGGCSRSLDVFCSHAVDRQIPALQAPQHPAFAKCVPDKHCRNKCGRSSQA